jgi:hypothetical protein
MKRLVSTIIASALLPLALMMPAHAAGTRGAVSWVCDVPGEGPVTFVAALFAAAHGINTANRTAGQTFHDRFGEVCTVVVAS